MTLDGRKSARAGGLVGLPLSGVGRTLAGPMVTFLTSPAFVLTALAVVAVVLVAAFVWLLRARPVRHERGGELDLSRAAARGDLVAFEWDWPEREPDDRVWPADAA